VKGSTAWADLKAGIYVGGWSVAGGPVVHSTQSPRISTATRALPSSDGRNGYVLRTLLSYTF
jgi:hypothetical protein